MGQKIKSMKSIVLRAKHKLEADTRSGLKKAIADIEEMASDEDSIMSEGVELTTKPALNFENKA